MVKLNLEASRWVDLPGGVRIKLRRLPSYEVLGMLADAGIEDPAQMKAAGLRSVVSMGRLAHALILDHAEAWNVDDEATGEPLPITDEAVGALLSQYPDTVGIVMDALSAAAAAAAGVDAEKNG
jgi:hypothetical protein